MVGSDTIRKGDLDSKLRGSAGSGWDLLWDVESAGSGGGVCFFRFLGGGELRGIRGELGWVGLVG